MTTSRVTDAAEAIYASLHADNEEIDMRIAELREAMSAEGQSEVTFDAARLPHNNRQGRKLLQSYFKKRGVKVVFGG